MDKQSPTLLRILSSRVAVSGLGENLGMKPSYRGHRFPPKIISRIKDM